MPITDVECPFCGGEVHTDGLIDGRHHLGCGRELPDEIRWENYPYSNEQYDGWVYPTVWFTPSGSKFHSSKKCAGGPATRLPTTLDECIGIKWPCGVCVHDELRELFERMLEKKRQGEEL